MKVVTLSHFCTGIMLFIFRASMGSGVLKVTKFRLSVVIKRQRHRDDVFVVDVVTDGRRVEFFGVHVTVDSLHRNLT